MYTIYRVLPYQSELQELASSDVAWQYSDHSGLYLVIEPSDVIWKNYKHYLQKECSKFDQAHQEEMGAQEKALQAVSPASSEELQPLNASFRVASCCMMALHKVKSSNLSMQVSELHHVASCMCLLECPPKMPMFISQGCTMLMVHDLASLSGYPLHASELDFIIMILPLKFDARHGIT